MSKPTLGLAINCQNEEHHMPISIAQFYGLVDDIVVVDGGSMDSTIMWAEKMGARVFHRPWKHNYADQKNFAASQLDTDWIYVHDPDERLDPTLLEVLPYLLDEDKQRFLMEQTDFICDSEEYFDCFGIARMNFLDGVPTGFYPDYQYRLFRKHCRYSDDPQFRIHQEIENFTKRTEVDFKRHTLDNPSRFNILHYKTSALQKEHDVLFPKIMAGEMD